MSVSGLKRSADAPEGPDEFPFTDEQVALLENTEKMVTRGQLAIQRELQDKYEVIYKKRNATLKGVKGFWPTALRNHAILAMASAHDEDVKALSFLEDIVVTRDPNEFRVFSFEMHFAPNPFFSETVLKKEAKYIAPTDPEAVKADENGISNAAVDFNWARDVESSANPIAWKSPDQALTKLYPRTVAEDDADDIEEPGSFFNIFEHKDVNGELEQAIALELYEDAIDYFFGRGANSLDSMMDSDDEDDDDSDQDDIDLEKPKKKVKTV